MKKYNKYNLTILSFLITTLLLSENALANERLKFNPIFIKGNKNLLIEEINKKNKIISGKYYFDIFLNNEFKTKNIVIFKKDKRDNKVKLCYSKNITKLLGLKEKVIHYYNLEKINKDKNNCIFFEDVFPEINIKIDVNDLKIDIIAPTSLIKKMPLDYISPLQWQDGENVFYVNYSTSYYQYKYNNKKENETFLSINPTLNLFNWTFKHQGSQSWINQKRAKYQNISNYAQTEIPFLRSQIKIGEFYSNNFLLDNYYLRGVNIFTDNRMLAKSLRGYAPVIYGVANSNAKVTIYQNGKIIKETTVLPGNFEINDLYQINNSDIEVEIQESNGEKRKFILPYLANINLLRKDFYNYSLLAGKYVYDNKTLNNVIQGELQYGLTNNITINTGGIYTRNYYNYLIGLNLNTFLGAFSVNLNNSNVKFNNKITSQGYRLDTSYNRRIKETDTVININNQHYFNQNYYNINEVMENSYNDEFLFFDKNNLKNKLSISVNQNLSDKYGYFYVNGSTATYNKQKREHEYQIGYSNSYKLFNYNISFSQFKNNEGKKDRRISFNLAIKLDKPKDLYLTQNLSLLNNQSEYNASINKLFGENKEYSFNFNFGQNKDNVRNYSTNLNYLGSKGDFGASYSKDNKHNEQMSLSANGSIVIHKKGITLSEEVSDTFAIIHAKDAKNTKINNSRNYIDYFGNGIVPYLEPYEINEVSLDINSNDNVEFYKTSQKIIPRANSAVYVNFPTKMGNTIFFKIKNIDKNNYPLIGENVIDENGKTVGYAMQGAKIYTKGLENKKGFITLKLKDNQTCKIHYDTTKNNESIKIIEGECK